MPTLETLTKADLKGPLKSKSLNRARGYIHQVLNPARSGHTLTAQVRGSRLYEVEIDVEPGGISAICSCPYNWGGYCKHIGAVLLKWIQSPGDFAVAGAATTTSNEYSIDVTPVEPPPTQRLEQPPFWLAFPFTERLRADEEQLRQWLNGVRLQDLRLMAKQRGWKVKGTRKADIVRQVSERIADPRGLLQAIRDLDDEHRQVLRALVLLGASGKIRTEELENVVGVWGKIESYQDIFTHTQRLCELGLALPGSVLEGYHNQSDFVPRAIARALPPLLKNVIPTASHPQSDVGDMRLADPRPFVRAVNQVALLLEQYPTPLRPPMPRPRMERFYPGLKGWDYDPRELAQAKSSGKLASYDTAITVPPPARSLPDETIERLSPVAGDEARLEFIYSLLVAVGVLQPGSPVTIWSEVKEQFLRQSELAQRAILAQIYFRMLNWSALWEMLRESDLRLWRFHTHQYLKPNNLHTDLVFFRQAVLRSLASLPDGEWVAIKDLFRLMRAVCPRFDHSVWQNYWQPSLRPSWFLGSKSGLSPDPKNANDWELFQGRFIRQIITGPLHWLGLADLCFADGVLTAARFHGLADLYWDRIEIPDAPPTVAAQASPVPPEEAIDTDSHTITVVPSAISPQAHNLLNKIARLEAATAERFAYRLDSQTTYESFETGVALSELFDSWEQTLPIPMPEAIRDQLTAWWDAYGRVRIYENLTVIEFSDDYALAEMKAVTPLEKSIIAEISPRLVIIRQEAVAPLTESLEKAGYTPKQTDKV